MYVMGYYPFQLSYPKNDGTSVKVPIYISKENTEYYQQYNNQYNGTQYENANWTRYLDQLNSKAYSYSLRNKVEQSLIKDNFEY